MNRKKYALWIEDDAAYNLQWLAAPVVMHLDYDLTLAVTITEAIHFLQRQTYDAIIVDLRMPPGRARDWIKLDQQLANARQPPRLGLHLLLDLFEQPQKNYELSLLGKKNKDIKKFGILSVDAKEEVAKELSSINFNGIYEQKYAGMPTNTLLKIIERTIEDY